MIRIPILCNPVPGSPAEELLNRMIGIERQVEKRAYELYRKRAAAGDPVNDWKQAESEFICKPAIELSETESDFHIRVALPGVDARCTRIAAIENVLLIEAECNREKLGNVSINELPCKMLYRKVTLPGPIHAETVTAVLDRGLLHIKAPKAANVRYPLAATA